VRVLIVDDHEFFRRGLHATLTRHGFEVAGEARTGEEGVAMTGALRPDAVLMDLNMPGISGAEAVARIVAAGSPPPVIVLTVSARSRDLHDALAAGAAGYLLKDSTAESIGDALRGVARGETRLSTEMTGVLADRVRELGPPADPGDGGLTPRELEVLRLLARGHDNPGIGATLHISPHTVKTHVTAIVGKLGARNRVEAAAVAVRRGLV
jgi:DNA-binding NarL/FixJ family response regulator